MFGDYDGDLNELERIACAFGFVEIQTMGEQQAVSVQSYELNLETAELEKLYEAKIRS